MSPTDGLVKFVSKHLDRLESALTRVAATRDIEAVHELRVASRRLTEPLELISRSTGAKRCARLQKTLRAVRNALRDVRDADVLLIALADSKHDGLSGADDIAKLQGMLVIHRENDLVAARKTIRRLEPDAVRNEVAKLCQSIERKQTRRRNKCLLASAREFWRHKAEALLDRPPSRDHGPGIHKTRIRLKALRYATELMSRLDGESRDDLLKQFAAMQDRLGAWNDHFCAARLLTQLARDEQMLAAGPEWSAKILDYAARRARRMNDELSEILIGWPRLRGAIESQVLGRVQSEATAAPRAAVANPRLAVERV